MRDGRKQLLVQGQKLWDVPQDLANDFLKLFAEHFPDHEVTLTHDTGVKLLVYPPLTDDERLAWRQHYRQRLFAIDG